MTLHSRALYQIDTINYLPRILAKYQACHVTYHFEVSSKNLQLVNQSQNRIQNPAFLFVSQPEIQGGNVKVICRVTGLILCKDSTYSTYLILLQTQN